MDERLFTLLNSGWSSPLLDWWSALVRATDIWIIPALVGFALACWKGSARTRGAAVLLLLVFALGDAIIVRGGKYLVDRKRPDEVLTVRSVRLTPTKPRALGLLQPLTIKTVEPGHGHREGRSFPSGHAWNAFAAATVLTLCSRRLGWIAFLPAAAIAYARVHAGLHWPSDVIVSGILSVPASALLAIGLDRAWRARIQPLLARRWRWARGVPSLLPIREPAT